MILRLPRTELLTRLTAFAESGVQILEAPAGFGKSWLLRRAAPRDALRLRGGVGRLFDNTVDLDAGVVIDDAHQLGAEDVERLVGLIEDAQPTARLMVAGRILPRQLHEVARMVDGLVLDAQALAITPDELVAEVPDLTPADAGQVVATTGGCANLVVTAVEQWQQQPESDPAAIASQVVRTNSAAVVQRLDPADGALVGLLARTGNIDETLLTSLGGARFLERVLAAGVPLCRRLTGDIDLVAGSPYRADDIDQAVAARLAAALVRRDRPIEAVSLLLDAGAHDRAAQLLAELPESVARLAEPRRLLAVLARLGSRVEDDPLLLLLRANASGWIGRHDSAATDVNRAAELAERADPRVRRRIMVATAARSLYSGDVDGAEQRAHMALDGLGPGEERTFARAHELLAESALLTDRRAELQRAAEWHRTAASAWESCGEYGNARMARATMARGVLVPLGRLDEALATLRDLLASPGISDVERCWLMACEAFTLVDARRLEAAETRFDRVSDLGYVQENPRMIALAAWGRAQIAAGRDDRSGVLRWSATAENTALGDADDLLGVPFLCDMATALGALGDLDAAERHLTRAEARPALGENHVRRCRFVLDARRGRLGDVDTQLEATPPSEWWRVELMSALAAARSGQTDRARRLLAAAERDLLSLGLADFDAVGERRAFVELQGLLAAAPQPSAADEKVVAIAPPQPAAALRDGKRVRVIGGPMIVEDGGEQIEIPAGNPQRLVGVIVVNGGMASFDQVAEVMWPGGDPDTSRTRLRNVLLRLRRGAGEIVARTGSGVRLAQGIGCDLYEFERLADDALTTVRNDPDLAGEMAEQAVAIADGPIFADFEYEEWAVAGRRVAETKLITLIDLLSVQAEDNGDLPRAQALAERALRLDRYTDSRYIRLAELLTKEGREAAAAAVLADATEAARELGAEPPPTVKRRRDQIIRRTASG